MISKSAPKRNFCTRSAKKFARCKSMSATAVALPRSRVADRTLRDTETEKTFEPTDDYDDAPNPTEL